MTEIQEAESWKSMLSAALSPCGGEPITLFFGEGSAAGAGTFKLVHTTTDEVIIAIPKDQIDQVLAPHVNLNRH